MKGAVVTATEHQYGIGAECFYSLYMYLLLVMVMIVVDTCMLLVAVAVGRADRQRRRVGRRLAACARAEMVIGDGGRCRSGDKGDALLFAANLS